MKTLKINVPMSEAEALALIALAKKERRHPREQAAYLLVKSLIACGELTLDATPQSLTRPEPQGVRAC